MLDVISAVICATGTVIGALLGAFFTNRYKKQKNTKSCNNGVDFLAANENFNHLLGVVDNIRMFSVNSYELFNTINTFLEQDTNVNINRITILVRYKEDETESDLKQLKIIISQWERWVKKGRIKQLTIVGYDHDPDHYYTVIGDKIVFFGQVFFDPTKPTGTAVTYKPLVFRGDTVFGQQVIKNFRKHFDNFFNHYKGALLLYNFPKN